MNAVRSLDEPYRSTIALRYFEGLTPKRISAVRGVPVKTVDTRLSRAHAALREKLDHECGERRAWVLAVAPLIALTGRDRGIRWWSSRLAAAIAVLGVAIVMPLDVSGDENPRESGDCHRQGRLPASAGIWC